MEKDVLTEVNIPGHPILYSGKVRRTIRVSKELGYLLMITTDLISAFDVVLPTAIPGKGRVLNQLSAFWFNFPSIKAIIPNHLVSADDQDCLAYLGEIPQELARSLSGKMMLVREAKRIDIECVVRGYLSGSAWLEYCQKGTVAGQIIPAGLRESEELPWPIFTPTTKSTGGHDQPISVEAMILLLGVALTGTLIQKSLVLYRCAHEYALSRGIILADTKLEFGLIKGKLVLIDELFTPDSSRFWDKAAYQPGGPQPSFDKQPVRDWLSASGWNMEPPAPPLPPEIVTATTAGYQEVYRRLVR